MSNEEIVEKMKVSVELIIKEKMKENINVVNVYDKKNVTKSIIAELDKVIESETNKN